MRAVVPWLVLGALSCSSGSGSTDQAAPDTATPSDAVDEVATDAAVTDSSSIFPTEDTAALPPIDDFSLGPYPSARDILIRSFRASAKSYNTSTTYAHSAAQGYLLQAIGTFLWATRGRALPERDELITLALGEIDELSKAANKVEDGQPGFGLADAWDAFQDGSTNPAYTCYAWQTGMVAIGAATLLRYLDDVGADAAARAKTRDFATKLLAPWAKRWTSLTEGGVSLGYYWYSSKTADAKATHNTSALISQAVSLLDPKDPKPAQYAALLARRVSTTSSGGYTWNYVDDGYPLDKRSPEDISHALLTLQFLRHAHEKTWLTDAHMARVATTILWQMWSGNPARMHGRVDGSSGGADEWAWTAAATVGMAAHADAGRAEIFDYTRSAIVSSYMTANGLPIATASVDGVRALAIAMLFAHRPTAFAPDSKWSRVPGDGDTMPGGVRFYTVDWGAPAPLAVDGIPLPARTSTAANANLLVDLDPAETRRVVVSLTYRADTAGTVQQWDGTKYVALAPLPATRNADGTVVWMRTSFLLNTSRFDYESGTPGTNVLLQLTQLASVARIEATPL